MLAYRHLFHAGGFADVFKHALLAQLLVALRAKVKPFLYMDTHAGAGLYDLSHPWARKNREYAAGIARVLARNDAPAALAPYLDAVRSENSGGALRWYPGSPRIARALKRAHDRVVLVELHPAEHEGLAALFAKERRTTVAAADGYEALKAWLPPPERRALVMIDPPFDRPRELHRLRQGLVLAHRRFATGIYALWYPLLAPGEMAAFERSVQATRIRPVLQCELTVRDDGAVTPLRGCGMLVVNPPYGFDRIARAMLEWLQPVLAGGAGTWRVRWLPREASGGH